MEMYDTKMTYVFCINLTGLILGSYLAENGIEVQYLDNDETKWNQRIVRHICISPNEADNSQQCIIAADSLHNRKVIRKQLENLGFSKIYDVDEAWRKEWVLGFAPKMDDKVYLEMFWYYRMGCNIDIEHPVTFNEKLQWLKLYDRQKQYTMMADKYSVKGWVKERIGEEYVIPTYGVYDNFAEIDFSKLPSSFVIKATHDSGSAIICENKEYLDLMKTEKSISLSLSRNKFLVEREFAYRDIKPRIIIEKYLGQTQDKITDYKFMCFNGNCKLCFTCTERNSDDGLKVTFFDLDWNILPFEREYPKSSNEIPKPKRLKDMIKLAERLASDIPFVRVDFYEIGEEIFFGEMTFYPGSGYEKFTPYEWDERIGKLITVI